MINFVNFSNENHLLSLFFSCFFVIELSKVQSKKLSFKNYKYSYCEWLLCTCLLQCSCLQFFLYHLQNSFKACRIISLNSIRNSSHMKNKKSYCVLKLDWNRIHQNLTSIRINFKISSVNAIHINLKILSYSVMNRNRFTLLRM